MALPLLLCPALALAEDDGDPPNLGYQSAIDSHRGFDDEALPRDGMPMTEPALQSAEPDLQTGVTPAGDRALPSDPAMAGSPAARDETLEKSGRSQRVLAFEHVSVRDDYAPYEASDGPEWVEANATVGEIGGWRAYARELYEPSVEAGDTAEPEDASMPASAMAVAEPGTASGAGLVGEMPMPVAPDATTRSGARDESPVASEPPQGARVIAYDSVLDDYAPYEESDGPNWLEANGTVGEIGGWRTYARELFEASVGEGDGQ